MQTKSEMINRIAELAEEVEQWKHEYEVLDACLELAQGKIAELKAENEKLIEDLGIANKYVNKYHQTLQEIKNILLQAMDVKSNAYNHFLKVEQAIDLITETEEE